MNTNELNTQEATAQEATAQEATAQTNLKQVEEQAAVDPNAVVDGVAGGISEEQEADVYQTDEDGKLEAFSLDDMDMSDLDDIDDMVESDTSVVEASEDLSLPTGYYIWYVGAAIPATFKFITKLVNGKTKPVKLYSAAVFIRVVYDITNNQPINESFLQNFYFYKKDGQLNRMGAAQAKNFATSVLSATTGATKEEVQQQLLDDKVSTLQLFKDLLPCEEDDAKYVTSKVRRKEGKGDYKGTFDNDIPSGVIKDASELYNSLVD